MSKVFEALARAGEEKHGQVQRPVEKVESPSTVEMLVEEKGSTTEPYANGAISKTNGAVHETHELYPGVITDEKPWREKIDEWLFGWGLGRYNRYPIIALETESSAAEQYKILREQVKRLRVESGIRSFSVTSPVKR